MKAIHCLQLLPADGSSTQVLFFRIDAGITAAFAVELYVIVGLGPDFRGSGRRIGAAKRKCLAPQR